MGESTVCLSHLVNVIAFADGVTGIIGSILDLVGESDMHWSALLGTGEGDNPAHAKGLGAA